MRIKKPHGNEGQEYIIFDHSINFEIYLQDSKEIKNGQEVKILNAPDRVEKGWVILKYDANAEEWNIIETEFPTNALTPDKRTIFKGVNGLLTSFDDIPSTTADFIYFTDLDIQFSISSFALGMYILKPDNLQTYQTIFGADEHMQKGFALTGERISNHDFNSGDGDYLVIFYNHFTYEQPSLAHKTQRIILKLSDYTPDLHEIGRDKAYIATVLVTIKDGSIVNGDQAKVWKHWQKNLPPVNMLIPPALKPDNDTIKAIRDNKFIALGNLQAYDSKLLLENDFDAFFDFEASNLSFKVLAPDGKVKVNASVGDWEGFLYLQDYTFNVNGFDDGEYILSFYSYLRQGEIGAFVGAEISKAKYYTPFIYNTSNYKTLLMTVCLKINRSMVNDPEDIRVYRHWKNHVKVTENSSIELSKESSSLTTSENYIDLDTVITLPSGAKLTQDFDYDISISASGNAVFKVSNEPNDFKEIPLIMADGSTKYFCIGGFYISQPVSAVGDYYFYHCKAYLRDAKQNQKPNAIRSISPDGRPLDLSSAPQFAGQVDFMTVRIKNTDILSRKVDDIRVYKHWKKSLFPAEERIILPEQSATVDETTIYKYPNDTLFVPDAKKCYRHDIFIKEDFDFKFDYSDPTKIVATPIGADQSGVKLVKAEIAGAEKLIKLNRLELYVSSRNWEGLFCSWYVMAHIVEDASGKSMSAGASINGLPTLFSPDGSTIDVQQVGIFSLVVRKPYEGQQWRTDSVQLYKWWKQVVLPTAPTEGLTPIYPDETSILYDHQNKLVSLANMNANLHDFRVFEDFDYKITPTSATSVRFEPRRGNRIVKASKFGQDLHLHLSHSNWILQPEQLGKWWYIKICCKLTETNITELQALTSFTVRDYPENLEPDQNYAATIMYAKIYVPAEGEAWNERTFQVYQLHKKHLGTFDELMENYKARHP